MKRMALCIAVALAIGGIAAAQSPPGRAGGRRPLDPRATIFVQRNCSACHGIWALGLRAKTDAAPDLTFAYLDVVNRYHMKLDAFLMDPTGVMRLMLAKHLHLSPEDRDSISHVLKAVYREHRTEVKGEIPPIEPDPAWPN